MKCREKITGTLPKDKVDILDILLADIRKQLSRYGFTSYFYLYKVNDVYVMDSVEEEGSDKPGFKLMYASKQDLQDITYTKEDVQLSLAAEYELVAQIEDAFLAIERADLIPPKHKIRFNSASKSDAGYETNKGIFLEGHAEINRLDEPEEENIITASLYLPKGDTVPVVCPASVFYREIGKQICLNRDPGSISYVAEDNSGNMGSASYEYVKTGYDTGYVKRKLFRMGNLVPVNVECKRYLRQLDAKRSTYCFYYMELKNDKLHVEYGDLAENEVSRYGRNSCEYPLDMYWIKYYEKINKGYVDYTSVLDGKEYKVAEDREDEKTVGYPSEAYEDLYMYLKKAVRSVVRKTIPNGIRITERLVVEANKQFSKLEKATSLRTFNKELEEFVRLVPRKLKDVHEIYAANPDDIPAILEREEQLLLAMQSVITMAENPELQKKAKTTKEVQIINPLKAEITYPTPEEEDWVRSHIRHRVDGKVAKIFKVYKPDQAARYEAYKARKGITKQRHLWHGSPTSNWSSIILNSLKCKPDCGVLHSSMFGPGIYFADDPNKSLKYTSLEGSYWEHGRSKYGIVGLYRVATGEEEITYASHQYSKQELQKLGKDSVFAKKGMALVNNEFIVFDDDASSIEYIVLFTTK